MTPVRTVDPILDTSESIVIGRLDDMGGAPVQWRCESERKDGHGKEAEETHDC